MNKLYKIGYATALIVFFASTMMASTVGPLIIFNSGTPISSADVNQNFTDLENAVNDNQLQISGNTTAISNHSTTLGNHASSINGNTTAIGNNATAINSNTTAIGNKVNKAGDTMTGALTVPSITYSTPRAASVTYAAAAFSAENSTMGVSKSTGGNGYTQTTFEPGSFFHAVDLPAGVVITSIQAYVYDNLSTDNVDIRLENQGILVTSVSTDPAQIGGYIQLNGSAISHTVLAGPVNYYSIEVRLSAPSASLGFYSVKVNYTYNTP